MSALQALRTHLPAGFTVTQPSGGYFLWLELPESVDARECLERAVDAGVAYVPGAPFFVDGGGANTLRLAFSKEDPDRIALFGGGFGRDALLFLCRERTPVLEVSR